MSQTEFEITESIKDTCYKARKSWFKLANLSLEARNNILKKLQEQLKLDFEVIISANKKDIENAEKENLNSALIDRLTLNEKRFNGIIESIEQIISLSDPLGIILDKTVRPNGLEISKISVPIGVIGLIFESRPNVTIEASALAIKSGNVIILKGGKESFNTNCALLYSITQTLNSLNLPVDLVSLIQFKERFATLELLKQKDTIDLIIPRGGEGLINFVLENSLIPVIKHYKGLCHTYIDKYADFNKTLPVIINAKVSRPATCNAMETLLVDKSIAGEILPRIIEKFKRENVELRGCLECLKIDPNLKPATEEDWETEYLDKILSIKIVDGLDKALEHIEKYGSRHSEAIMTENKINAAKFVQNVDAAAVFVNTSTRFNDGFEFGLGSELGISTDKIHARGPMGIREMTTYKYIVLGNGQIRQ